MRASRPPSWPPGRAWPRSRSSAVARIAIRCSRIALLHEGKVLALDQPGRLRAGLTGTLFEVVVPSPREAIDQLAGVKDIASAQVFGDRLHVWIDRPDPRAAEEILNRAAAAAGVTATSIRPIVPSLEDVFIARLAS